MSAGPTLPRLLAAPPALMLCIALLYLATGKLALLLAIPPGYATAIWPPAGIALGALLVFGQRFWPGVLLGSFLTNVATSFDPSRTLESLVMTGSIAAGAALQAYVGAGLIHRFLGRDIRLNNEREVFAFYLIGGPLACATNASIGVGTLAMFGAIPVNAIAYSWWTWWVGDTIGTLIFAPLILMWCSTDPLWRSRRPAVTLPLAGMLSAAILVFIYTSSAEWRDMEAEFQRDANDFAGVIERRVALNAQNLRSLSALFTLSGAVNPTSFQRMSESMLADHSEVSQVGWVPRVSQEQRAYFERVVLNDVIRQQATPAPQTLQEEYFPLLFSQARREELAIGMDLQSLPGVRAALANARATGQQSATVPIDLPNGSGLMLICPIQDASQAEPALLGFLYLHVRIGTLLEPGLSRAPATKRMQLEVRDTGVDARQGPVYSSVKPQAPGKPLGLRADIDLDIADRVWRLTFTPTLEFVSGEHAIIAWLVLAGGLLLSALVGAGALILTGRTSEVEALVGARTEELADINARLAEKICDHVRIEHALAGEKHFLSTVLENLDEGIVALNIEGKTTMANRAAKNIHQRITGTRHSGATWTSSEIFCGADATTPLAARDLPGSRALRGETVREFEMVSIVPDRPKVTVLVTAQPLLDRSGEQTGVIKMIRDITDMRKADRLKREFVAVVSHELRTPLTSIRGSLGLVTGGTAGELPEKARKLLSIAYRNSDRLSTLINDILDIEKIESGKLALSSELYSVRTLVLQAIEAHAGFAHECDVSVTLQETAVDAQVQVDANRLLQVLANLLSNASKFSPRRAVVEVGIAARGPRVRVSVRDRGPGIPEEFRPYMFQKFSQVDGSDSRAKPGTGLGLAICKGLMERMGGCIDYAANPGGGTVFFFDLPIDAASAPDETLTVSATQTLSKQGS